MSVYGVEAERATSTDVTMRRAQLLWSLRQRELDSRKVCRDGLRDAFHMSPSMLARLGLLKQLEGHEGCVNCLQWSHSGQLLASGSDDQRIAIWSPCDLRPLRQMVKTQHRSNIFSVKFVPWTNDALIASGAGDFRISVLDVTKNETIALYSHHNHRVKRLEVCPNEPHLLFSASEDGLVSQMDLRVPVEQGVSILVNLNGALNNDKVSPQAKCIASNPTRSHLIAVGATDAFVRVYDRRSIRTQTLDSWKEQREMAQASHSISISSSASSEPSYKHVLPSTTFSSCLQYYVAGHLRSGKECSRYHLHLASTFVAFSPKGNELLVNLGGEQIYLFDMDDEKESVNLTFVDYDNTNPHRHGCNLSPEVEQLKQRANAQYEESNYSRSIAIYNDALALNKSSPILLANRAAAYMKRQWDGDIYCALRDARRAIEIDPLYFKAHIRLVRCMLDLGHVIEAEVYLHQCHERFPEERESASMIKLQTDIKTKKRTLEERGSDKNGNRNRELSNEMRWSQGRHRELALRPEELDARRRARDFKQRYCGHCNTTTDIKEANFFGNDIVMAGSDDGKFFCWDKNTSNIKRVLVGDESIVNCLQPHPHYGLLASSGIDNVVRLWMPTLKVHFKHKEGEMDVDSRVVSDSEAVAVANQRRMNEDPFEALLLSMDMVPYIRRENNDDDDDDDEDDGGHEVQCRQS